MATLDKMAICGIRSFGPEQEDTQTISFKKPLTLILGENGCGKSTIIECLRYVTAFKDPAGKGTFVHDPSLTNKSLVKGFVKLRLLDRKGNKVDLVRQVQATKTKKSVTTRSIDNVITRIDKITNEKSSISNRCVDFTSEIIRIFGVSKAILENVIFCTQEDSHWPLETDQKLKEKFDQIFDSEKYNKALTRVREKKKKLKQDITESETALKYLEQNKASSLEKKRQINRLKVQVDECSEEIRNLNTSLVPVEDRMKELIIQERDIGENMALKATKETELKTKENFQIELKARIGDGYPGSDSELRERIRNFSGQLSARQEEVSRLEDEVRAGDRNEGKLSRDMMQEQGRLGQLQKEEELNKEKITDRNRRLNGLAMDLGIIESTQMQMTEETIEDRFNQIQSQINKKGEELTALLVRLDGEEQDLQNSIDRSREEYVVLQNRVANKQKEMSENQKEVKKIRGELDELDQSASKLAKLEAQLSKTNKNIEELKRGVDAELLKAELKKSVDDRKKLEDRLTDVEEEVGLMQQQAAVVAELDVQLEAKASKESDIRRLMNKHEDTVRSLLGTMPESGFKVAIQEHVDKLQRQVKELTSLRSRKDKELVELEMNRKHLKEQLRAKEETLRSGEEEIYNECESGEFEETVTSLQSQVDELLDVKGTLSSSEFMYDRYIRALQKQHPCCPLCHRDFERQIDAQTLIEELTGKVKEVPSRLNENKQILEQKQGKYNKLLTLRPTYEQLSVLKNDEIPRLRTSLEKTEASLKKTRKEVEELENDIYAPQTDEAICRSIQGDMVLLDQLQTDQRKLDREIDKLKSKLGGSSSNRGGLQEAIKEQDSLRQSLKITRDHIEELQTKLHSFNEKFQSLQTNKNRQMEDISRVQGGAGSRMQLETRFSDLQALEIVLMEELDELRERLEPMKKSLDDLSAQRNVAKKNNAATMDRKREKVNFLKKAAEDAEAVQRLIKVFEGKGIGKKLENAISGLKKTEMEIENLKRKKEEAVREMNEIKKDLSNQKARERELEDNLSYREKEREMEGLRKEVAALKARFGNFNIDQLLKEKRSLKCEEERIGKKKSLIQGRIGEIESQIEQLENELQSKIYKTVEEDYKKCLIKNQVLVSVSNDLHRYAVTMDWAMTKYHEQQMTRVNSFVREYWRKIYQGNDIDCIEIKMDDVESKEKRRNYSYRLVQIKSEVSLDMRNRCSAGQKMLASLIIRMALAETFSNNCGVLTLDEPTTNLDRKNIKNLARTLHEVLLAKEQISNSSFQLVVITHDEEFVQALMEMDAVSECIRVDRNFQGKSRIVVKEMNGADAQTVIPTVASMKPSKGKRLQYD